MGGKAHFNNNPNFISVLSKKKKIFSKQFPKKCKYENIEFLSDFPWIE
jgi:hypothetical protein